MNKDGSAARAPIVGEGLELERTIVAQRVLDTLKGWIREQRLLPDDWIRQDAVARTLGVSRVPVREALRGLAAEGLVEIIPHRGARVVRLSWRRFLEATVLRAVVETACCRFVTERVDDDGLRRLDVAFERLRDAEMRDHRGAEDADPSDVGLTGSESFKRNWEFHMTLFGLSDYDVLVETIERLWESTAAYRSIYLADEHVVSRRLQDEHRAMVLAVQARDAEELSRLHTRHRERMLSYLKANVFTEEAKAEDCGWLLDQLEAPESWWVPASGSVPAAVTEGKRHV